jgi:hypothetical protein
LQEAFGYVYKKQNPSISFIGVEPVKAREPWMAHDIRISPNKVVDFFKCEFWVCRKA